MNIILQFIIFTLCLIMANCAGLFIVLFTIGKIYRYLPQFMKMNKELDIALWIISFHTVWVISCYKFFGYALNYPPVMNCCGL